MIQTHNIAYNYPGKPTITFPDISCNDGKMMLVLGHSGVGKTTLLHLLSGLLRANEGSVMIDGTDIGKLCDRELDHFRGQHIGIIFQKLHFIKSLNVLENLTIAQKLAEKPINEDKCIALLENLQMGHKLKSKINELSQGETQRVAIARALVNDPSVILADEPTSALDDMNCDAVINLLSEQAARSGAALVIVTHDTRLKEKINHQITIS